MNKIDIKYKYNVALSFAGEQRDYVETVASILKNKGIKVFYDKYEQVNMWGKNLVDHLENIFGNEAEYIVIFLSKEYATKDWPDYERQVLLSRWINEKGNLLPVRFDDSEIKGLPSSVVYLDLRKMTPEELAQAIIKKISKPSEVAIKSDGIAESTNFRLPKKVVKINPYEERKKFIEYVTTELEHRCKQVDILDFYGEDIAGKRQIRILLEGEVLYALDIHKGGMGDDSGVSFSYGIRNASLGGYNAWGNFEWDKEKEGAVLKLNDFSMLGNFGSGELRLKYEEFVEKIWEFIINLLDEDK